MSPVPPILAYSNIPTSRHWGGRSEGYLTPTSSAEPLTCKWDYTLMLHTDLLPVFLTSFRRLPLLQGVLFSSHPMTLIYKGGWGANRFQLTKYTPAELNYPFLFPLQREREKFYLFKQSDSPDAALVLNGYYLQKHSMFIVLRQADTTTWRPQHTFTTHATPPSANI